MTQPGFAHNGSMFSWSKYARVEFERRFLLDRFPADVNVTSVRRIVDRYIEGTRLRLRQMTDGDGKIFKLTQKIPEPTVTARRGLITTIYLSQEEFDVLSKLPGKMLAKTRYSAPPFGIDVFEDELDGLLLAEAEFDSDAEASAFEPAPLVSAEVTNDPGFTGGSLAAITRDELLRRLAGYGVELQP